MNLVNIIDDILFHIYSFLHSKEDKKCRSCQHSGCGRKSAYLWYKASIHIVIWKKILLDWLDNYIQAYKLDGLAVKSP